MKLSKVQVEKRVAYEIYIEHEDDVDVATQLENLDYRQFVEVIGNDPGTDHHIHYKDEWIREEPRGTELKAGVARLVFGAGVGAHVKTASGVVRRSKR
jgi:hypothetical protein